MHQPRSSGLPRRVTRPAVYGWGSAAYAHQYSQGDEIKMFTKAVVFALVLGIFAYAFAQPGPRAGSQSSLPAGYWPIEKSQPIIDKTQTIRLAPDLSQLSAGERKAVAKLLEVGKIFQNIYEDQRHKQALSSYRLLNNLGPSYLSPAPMASENLLTLYRLFQGPIATTLENKREPFLPVDPVVPGKNMYPWGVKKEDIENFLTSHQEKRDEIMDLRTVVRTESLENLRRDLTMLAKYPALATLHPGLGKRLKDMFQTQMKRQR